MNQPSGPGAQQTEHGFAEFLVLMALLISLTAFSIDIMLPALPHIGQAFAVSSGNGTQAVVTVYLAGLAIGQLFYGPLSDRIGRKPALLLGLAIYLVATLAAVLVTTFPQHLAARAVQGFGAAAARVVSIAIVRDRFAGRPMARVMSIIMSVFIIVPMIAPLIGQGLLLVGDWTWTYHILLGVGIVSALWAATRLAETRAIDRPPIPLRTALTRVLTSRVTVAYTLAGGLIWGCLVAYLASSQQVFVSIYGLGASFPLAFAGLATAMAAANMLNARLVQKFGMRRLSHLALVGFVLASCLHVAASWTAIPSFVVVLALLWLAFFAFGFIVSNFNAIAMHPLGEVAGTASSFTGFTTTALGVLTGGTVGRLFDGSTRPLALGFAVLAALALVSVATVEGRAGLFRGE